MGVIRDSNGHIIFMSLPLFALVFFATWLFLSHSTLIFCPLCVCVQRRDCRAHDQIRKQEHMGRMTWRGPSLAILLAFTYLDRRPKHVTSFLYQDLTLPSTLSGLPGVDWHILGSRLPLTMGSNKWRESSVGWLLDLETRVSFKSRHSQLQEPTNPHKPQNSQMPRKTRSLAHKDKKIVDDSQTLSQPNSWRWMGWPKTLLSRVGIELKRP